MPTIQNTGELTGDPLPELYGKTPINGTRIPIRYSWVAWALARQEGSGVEILLEKLVWPALAADANFRNMCLLGTFRTCVKTS